MTHLYKLSIPESSKNSTFLLKNSPNIRYSTQYLTQYLTRYSTRGRRTRPQSIIFTNRNRLDSGHRVLVFAPTASVESGLRFAEIWCKDLDLELACFFSVCQFRFDFKQFSLTNPPSNGDCSTVDSMVISTSGQLTPMICGKNISTLF